MVKPASSTNRAVFLDRDGVLNESIVRDGLPYSPRTVSEFRLYPESIVACRLLQDAGFLTVVVTNQPDVGRGLMEPRELAAMHERLLTELALTAVETCCSPGTEAFLCPSRKPGTGMLLRVAERLDIRLEESFMVGDRWRDVACGLAAGCRTIFVDRGYKEELKTRPDHCCSDVLAAARWILDQS